MAVKDIVLAVCAVLLLGSAAWMGFAVPAPVAVSAAPVSASIVSAAETESAPLSPRPMPSQDALAEIVNRSLFNPTRQGIAAAPKPPAPKAPPKTDIYAVFDTVKLVGLVTESGKAFAVFETQGGADSLTLAVGDTLGDWTLSAMESDTLTLVSGAEEKTLDFPLSVKMEPRQ